jgi:hypothetical protein
MAAFPMSHWGASCQTSEGQSIWLATASLERGLELAHNPWLPTHQIAPDVDTALSFVVSSLQTGGDVAQSEAIQLVPAEFGRNFDGDAFFTDGQTEIITLQAYL